MQNIFCLNLWCILYGHFRQLEVRLKIDVLDTWFVHFNKKQPKPEENLYLIDNRQKKLPYYHHSRVNRKGVTVKKNITFPLGDNIGQNKSGEHQKL